MKKLTIWKKIKEEAVKSIIESIKIENCNRYTKKDLSEALNKDSLENIQDLRNLIKYCLDNFKQLKFNTKFYIINIQIIKFEFENKILFKIKPNNIKKWSHFMNLRSEMIEELENLIQLNNNLSNIFGDNSIIQPFIYDNPEWGI